MNTFKNAMAFLLSAVAGMREPLTERLPGIGEEGSASGATKKGYKHKVNPSARSKPGEVSPAQYRREHRGANGKKQ